MAKALSNKVLLIGWDAADWKVIAPLVDAGKMPNMKRFLEQGVMGNLATLYPILSPVLWTSIATGKRAYGHGVHGFSEPDPQTGGVRPITNLARTTKAIWNILNQEGKRCNVVGWWPSYPVEPINGVMVSNHYQESVAELGKPWPMPKGTIHPERLIEPLARLRIHPLEIQGEQLEPFVPKAREIDQDKDKRLYSVAKILAECSTIQAAATGIMQLEPWDFMGVYFDAIDHFGHGFMRYHPPKSSWISQEDFDLYSQVIETGYCYHDFMLGVMMELAGPDTTIIIVSDHGFHPDRLRPQYIPNEPAGPAEEHRPFGIIAMCGPGIKKDEVIFGASLLDVTPTILSIFGLPVGRDMEGKVLLNALDRDTQVEYIDSWDEVEGDSAMHPPDMRIDSINSAEALKHLVDLGYIDELDGSKEKARAETIRELRYNLARSYVGAGREIDAAPIYQELWDEFIDESRFGVHLFNAYLALNNINEARSTFAKILERKQATMERAKVELEQLIESLKEKKPEDYSDQEKNRINNLQKKAGISPTTVSFMSGCLAQAEGNYSEAIKFFEEAKSAQTHDLPSLYQRIANLYLAEKNYRQAEAHFLQVQELDPVNAEAHLGLAKVHLRQNRPESAIEQALACLGLIYHNPQAHLIHAMALYRSGRVKEAIQSLEIATSQNPVFPAAYRYLSSIYVKNFQDADKANQYRLLAKESLQRIKEFKAGNLESTPSLVLEWLDSLTNQTEDPLPTSNLEENIVIVSGLPRSGTSMLMQMLAAGGLPVLTDQLREADANNPLGYYELEQVKKLAEDSSWLEGANGKAVKIIVQLLPKLPPKKKYRIIFMQRPMAEVIASQEKMLQKLNKTGGNIAKDKLAQVYIRDLQKILNMINQYPGIDVLYINYHDVVRDPASSSNRINRFLGGQLDQQAMALAVKPELWNQKAQAVR